MAVGTAYTCTTLLRSTNMLYDRSIWLANRPVGTHLAALGARRGAVTLTLVPLRNAEEVDAVAARENAIVEECGGGGVKGWVGCVWVRRRKLSAVSLDGAAGANRASGHPKGSVLQCIWSTWSFTLPFSLSRPSSGPV
eukprot:1176914-Prorocentrum_minimum.AAC.5